MVVRCALVLLIGWASQLAAFEGSPPKAMSLEAVYGLAVDRAPSLAIAQYRSQAAKAQWAEARGAVLPQLSLFGEWSENTLSYDGPLSALYGEEDYPGERYGFQARQTLFNVSQFREVQRRDALFDRSESDLAQAGIELLAQVTNAYLTVLIADNTVSQFQEESEALVKQLEEAQALYARALLPLTQVLETQTRSEAVKADLIEAEGEAAIARERLTELIGVRDFALMPIAEAVVLTPRLITVEQAVAEALHNSPAVSAAEESVSAAEYGVKREKGTWWPEVSLIFNQQYSDVGFDNLTSPPRTTESLSIAVNYPLSQGGSGAARVRGAWAEYYATKEELEGVKREVATQTRSAWVRLSAANKRIVAAQQAVETATVNVSAAQKSVKAGTARITDVLFALAQRTRARRDRFFAEQQRIMAWLELELITGTAPSAVAPVLSDALLSTAAVSATAAGQ
jgi:outer membrane protein